jgi:hypothetical protein
VAKPTAVALNSDAAIAYVTLPALVELKLAAGRARDEYDVIELIRANEAQIEPIREHLAAVHADYVAAFNQSVTRAREQEEAGDR